MKQKTLNTWIKSLSEAKATPSSDSVAALSAVMANALVCRICSYTTGEKWRDRAKDIKTILDEATELQKHATQLMEADDEIFNSVMEAYAMPSDTPAAKATRSVATKAALDEAAKQPQQVAIITHRTVKLCSDLALMANPVVISQVAVAANLARCALESAIVSMQANQKFIVNPVVSQALVAVISAAQSDVQVAHAVMNQVQERIANS